VVKTKVRDFFKDKFKGVPRHQVRLDNVRFNAISGEDNVALVASVNEEEVKNVVWRCNSSKSLDSDGFNFSFIRLREGLRLSKV